MHRLRCVLAISTALYAAGFCAGPTFAQPALAQNKSDAASSSSASVSNDRLATRMRLGDGRKTWQPTRRQIGVSYAPGLSDDTPHAQVQFVVDRAKLRAYLNKIAKYVKRSPKDAKVVVASGVPLDSDATQVPATIVPGYDGATLDIDAAVDAIQKAIQADPATVHIVLPIKTTPANVRTADLKGINARIAYFSTHFNAGEVGRTRTVRLAIQIIDGTVVPPGQVFSVNQTVGERTAKRGFGKSEVFIDGHMEKQVGGGMCQVATTLFNAAMLGDLKIVERHPHMRTIPYAPPGRDATVYYGQKDFKFQNNTGAPLYVSYKTTHSHAIVSIFGKAVPGRRVVLVGHSRRLGPRHYTGTFYRVVYNPDGTKEKGKVFHSSYKWTPALDYNQ